MLIAALFTGTTASLLFTVLMILVNDGPITADELIGILIIFLMSWITCFVIAVVALIPLKLVYQKCSKHFSLALFLIFGLFIGSYSILIFSTISIESGERELIILISSAIIGLVSALVAWFELRRVRG
ncbi:MAG: hypothetical protein MI976_15435 [Pseudomonadales bacterium]|nr:hypothetical protein [Pseudomonadales bacterium]